MSAKHTPGPWKACFNEEACHFKGVTRHGWTIDGPKMVPDYECDMFNEADARLIAAAPVLLDQLRFAVALLKPIFGNTPQIESMESAIAEAIG